MVAMIILNTASLPSSTQRDVHWQDMCAFRGTNAMLSVSHLSVFSDVIFLGLSLRVGSRPAAGSNVVYLCLSSSLVAQLFGHRHAGWSTQQVLSLSCIFGSFGVFNRFLMWLVCWWKQYHDSATSCTDLSDLRNCDNSCSVCVGKHVTVSRYCRSCARLGDGRSTVGSGASSGSKPWQDNGKESMRTQQWDHGWTGPTSKFLNSNTGVHVPTMETRSSTLAGNLIVAEEPAGWMALETAQRRKSDSR